MFFHNPHQGARGVVLIDFQQGYALVHEPNLTSRWRKLVNRVKNPVRNVDKRSLQANTHVIHHDDQANILFAFDSA